MNRLQELFNVNYFLVSQTNPHAIPFVQRAQRGLQIGRHGQRGRSGLVSRAFSAFFYLIKSEIVHRFVPPSGSTVQVRWGLWSILSISSPDDCARLALSRFWVEGTIRCPMPCQCARMIHHAIHEQHHILSLTPAPGESLGRARLVADVKSGDVRRCEQAIQLGLAPKLLALTLNQKYVGDVTIVPPVTFSGYRQVPDA